MIASSPETAPVEPPFSNEPLRDSSSLRDDPAALRARAGEDGYLLLRGLLPARDVWHLRRKLLEILDGRGLLRKGAALIDGVADIDRATEEASGKTFGTGVSPETYAEVQRLEEFHAIAHHPRLLAFYDALFGEKAFPHPRNIARLMLPSRHFSPTPAHQDYTHIQGAREFWTCWFPLGDCPIELGGLAVLVGSHRDGIRPYSSAKGAGGLESIICQSQRAYQTASLEAGDILTFSSHTVHKGMPNGLEGRIRLSCDFRYQPASLPIEKKSLEVHCDVTSWEDIYSAWRGSGHLKYYWKNRNFEFSGWDDSLVMTQRRICN